MRSTAQPCRTAGSYGTRARGCGDDWLPWERRGPAVAPAPAHAHRSRVRRQAHACARFGSREARTRSTGPMHWTMRWTHARSLNPDARRRVAALTRRAPRLASGPTSISTACLRCSSASRRWPLGPSASPWLLCAVAISGVHPPRCCTQRSNPRRVQSNIFGHSLRNDGTKDGGRRETRSGGGTKEG